MSEIICSCLGTTREEIEQVIKEGATMLEAVTEITQAGAVCGACNEQIEAIIDEMQA